jgi:photosystem II stability/assembly factor-like uncharacterized protein
MGARNKMRTNNHMSSLLLLCFLLMPKDVVSQELSDRLKTPSRAYSNVEKTAFLDVELIGSRLIAIGERGVIAYSDDAGDTWAQAEVPISSMLTSINFADDFNGWAVGHGGVVLHSQDQGMTWQEQLNGNQINKMLMDVAQQNLKLAQSEYQQAEDEDEKEDLLYGVEDAEFALSNAEFDSDIGPTNPFLDVWFKDLKTGYAVGAYGLFLMTNDGGDSWRSVAHRLENFDRYHLNSIKGIKGGVMLIVGEAGTMFSSSDQGESWETLYGPYQGSFFGLQETSVAGEVIVYGLKGNVFKSQNNGESWKKIEVPATTSITSSTMSEDGTITLTGFSGVIVQSNDGGDNFLKLNPLGLDAYNGIASLKNSRLVLVSESGVHFKTY